MKVACEVKKNVDINITSNSSHYICPRLGYHVYYVINCTAFITNLRLVLCFQTIELNLRMPQKFSCAIRKLYYLFIMKMYSVHVL